MATTHPRTFVRTVKAEAVCFDPIEDTLEQIRHKRSPDWAIFGFADQHESRNTLKVLAVGDGDLSDRSQWPPELFAPNALCYGFLRFEFAEGETFAPVFVSFCWKGRSLPIYLRTKYAEFNHVIRKHLKATNHMTLQHPDELAEGTFWQNMPPTTPRRKRSNSRRFVTNEIEFTSEVLQAVKDIRTDAAPFNWMVCGYDISECDGSVQKITVIDKGMAGLHALKGLGGITAILRDGVTMYLYLRVDIPIFHNAERIVPKFVLVTWQGVDNGLFSDDESLEGWNLSPLSDGNGPPLSSGSLRDLLPPTPSNSIVQRVMTAQKHGSEVTRFFPHHVHFSANSIMEITEETIRERVRRAVDNDCMLLRVVCIQRSGDTQSPICIEVPFDATVGLLRKEIASFVGIPEQQQQIVWIRQMDDFVNEFQRSTRAIVFNDDGATLRTDIGLGHGDKIHVGDNADGADSILDKLVKQINSGTVNVSLSAERRHEVQKGVEAREAELKKILSATHDLLRKRAGTRTKLRHVETAPVEPATEATIPTPDITQVEVAAEPEANDASDQQNGSTSPQGSQSDASEDESNLQEKARVLEEQNEYLEVPKESIRILGGKENELGCGKAATVYRGLWLNKNGAAEVAIKLFRYVRLTDKILGDYTKEVALLRKLKHPNIVLFIGACTDSKLMILTEYCSRKSLYEVIHTPNFATIPWQYKVRMMLDAARGIQYLHSRRIIHRDIKSHNFLVDDDWRVKVADFGISKILENDATAYTQCGTTGWVAPEVLLDEDVGYTFKADNWSFAVVMWEMVADGLQNQFIGMAPIKFYNQTVHAGIRPPFPENVDPDYVALINECWHSNASDRPPFGEIVSRLEQMVLKIGGSIDLPPTYQGGYHHCLTNGE